MLAATWPTASLSMPRTMMRFGGRHLEGDAVGGVDRDGVAEAEGEVELAVALGGGAVADADDLQLLGEPLGDADDHVVDERPDQAVHGPVLALVVGPLDQQRPPSWRTVMAPGMSRSRVPLGPFTVMWRPRW